MGRGDDGERPAEPDGPDRPPFPWQGAPGYSGFDPERFPPHAPMPGAPPFPAGTEPEPAAVEDREPGAPPIAALLPRCLAAAAAWAAVALVIALVAGVASWPLRAAAIAAPMLVTTAALLVPARRGAGPVALAFAAFGAFWVLHAVAVALLG